MELVRIARQWYNGIAERAYSQMQTPSEITMPATSYEQLDAWKRGMDLVCEVYRVTQLLPSAERFGLVAQLRRAAVSIPSNIAEGSGRQGRRELLHHLSIARGSLKELETLLAVLERLRYVVPAELAASRDLCGHVSRLTYGMRRKLAV